MINPAYGKAYQNVKESVPQFKNSEEALAFYLKGTSKHLHNAFKAAQEGRIEDRSNSSDKAMLILSGILSHFDRAPPEEKKAAKGLTDYCKMLNELIIRMNMKNDSELAESLSREVRKMADAWVIKSQEAHALTAQELQHSDTIDTSA